MTGVRAPKTLALIGYGRLARDYYAPAIKTHAPSWRLVIAEPLAEARAAAQRAFGEARIFESASALFDARRPDAVIIATPPSTHFAIWRLAQAAGAPTLVEKPFPTPDDLNPFDGAGAGAPPVMINHNRRFWPEYQAVVRAGEQLAPLRRINVILIVDADAWSTVTRHRFVPGEGGALRDLGAQAVDLALWVAGRAPISVRASRCDPESPKERAEIVLEFGDRLEARLNVGYDARMIERLRIIGEGGEAALDDPNRCAYRGARPSLADLAVGWTTFAGRALDRRRSMLRSSVASALQAFLGAIETNRAMHPGLPEGLAVARVLKAAEESIAAGAAARPDAHFTVAL